MPSTEEDLKRLIADFKSSPMFDNEDHKDNWSEKIKKSHITRFVNIYYPGYFHSEMG